MSLSVAAAGVEDRKGCVAKIVLIALRGTGQLGVMVRLDMYRRTQRYMPE